MKVTKTVEEKTLTVKLEGRLDTASAPAVEKEIYDAMEGIDELRIDCRALEYISSSGLRILLNLQKMMNAGSSRMTLVNVGEIVMDVLEMTGFTGILNIENSDEAK